MLKGAFQTHTVIELGRQRLDIEKAEGAGILESRIPQRRELQGEESVEIFREFPLILLPCNKPCACRIKYHEVK